MTRRADQPFEVMCALLHTIAQEPDPTLGPERGWRWERRVERELLLRGFAVRNLSAGSRASSARSPPRAYDIRSTQRSDASARASSPSGSRSRASFRRTRSFAPRPCLTSTTKPRAPGCVEHLFSGSSESPATDRSHFDGTPRARKSLWSDGHPRLRLSPINRRARLHPQVHRL